MRGKPDENCPYTFLDRAMQWHPDLAHATIAIAWMHDVKPDKDGHLLLARCKKASDLDREFRDFDVVVLLNAAAWKQLDGKQRLAVVDHQLCHATEQTDKNGDPLKDEKDRKVYRLRKHDVEEFNAIVHRHGVYLSQIAEFVRQATEAPLFKEEANGEAAKKED